MPGGGVAAGVAAVENTGAGGDDRSREIREKKMQFFFVFLGGFCMDFLGNQTRVNFPGKRMREEIQKTQEPKKKAIFLVCMVPGKRTGERRQRQQRRQILKMQGEKKKQKKKNIIFHKFRK